MNILITGTAGFIGFHLANLLSGFDHEILGLDVINDYYDIQLKYDRLKFAGINKNLILPQKVVKSSKISNYRFIQAELGNKDEILRVFESFRPEIVIHLAAQAGVRYSLSHPEAYIKSNIEGFLNILEACRKYPVNHLLYASSSSVYGLNKSIPFSVHNNVDHPVSLYAASKKSNELMAHTYSHLFGIPSTGLRFFTVYGPWGRPDMALFIFTRAILDDKPFELFNNGKMERDFTYVDDIVGGISRMLDNPPGSDASWDAASPDPSGSSAPYRIYNIGNNKPVKLTDFVAAIENATGKKAQIIMKPIQPGDVEKTWADVEELVRDFNYRPSTPIQTGINKFIEWYKDYYKISN